MIVPKTLNKVCTIATLLAVLFELIAANQAVIVVPILSPKTRYKAPSKGINPVEARTITIPMEAEEL